MRDMGFACPKCGSRSFKDLTPINVRCRVCSTELDDNGKTMRPDFYQGWSNRQTWCVALTFNNSRALQSKALAVVRDQIHDQVRGCIGLYHLALTNWAAIREMADWCWESGHSSLHDAVDWSQIFESYVLQIEEEERLVEVEK